MPVSLAGLPTRARLANFVHDLLIRSGELANQPSFEEAVKAVWGSLVVPMLDEGYMEIISVGDEKWITNSDSKMTKDYRLCMEPRTQRHAWGTSKGNLILPPMYAEEQEVRAGIRWTVNRQMMAIIQKAALLPEFAKEVGKDPAINIAERFLRSVDNGGQPWFHIAPFFDDVGREYGEGLLTYTSNQMIRNTLEFYDSVYYNPVSIEILGIDRIIENQSGVSLSNYKELLANWQTVLLSKEYKNPWLTLRMAIFYEEVITKGYSGAHLEPDFVTSGPMVLGLLSRDRNMMADTSMFGTDNRDCRRTVAELVTVPNALLPWGARLKSKDAAKPFVTQTTYGQGPKGAVAGLFWKDAKKAPDSWLSSINLPSVPVMDKLWVDNRNLFNEDWIDIIRELGWVEGYSALYDLSSEYYNSFWGAYHHLKQYCQSIEKAGRAFTTRTGRKPEFTNIGGWKYAHHKWEVAKGGKVIRCRYNGFGCQRHFPKGLEFSIGEMVDLADPYSLVVRMTHQSDAWIRMMLFYAIRKWQLRYWGRYVGHGAVHDALILPVRQAVEVHRIVRPVMHRFVDQYVPSMDQFLIANGQESPKPLSAKQMDLVHWSIAHHTGWMKF